MRDERLNKLEDQEYRNAYVGAHVRRGLAYQIRTLRDKRGWSQGEFSKRLGKPQSVVSRLENPSYGKLSIETLTEIAATLDIALSIRFVAFSEFLTQTGNLSSEAMNVPSFGDDAALTKTWLREAPGAFSTTMVDNTARSQPTSVQLNRAGTGASRLASIHQARNTGSNGAKIPANSDTVAA